MSNPQPSNPDCHGPALVPGYVLDRYELLCPIAQGGMAQVWIARLRGKHGFEKLVAIKTILSDHATDARFQHMLLDEARIASRIEHANVARTHDLGDEHGVLYLVMEWVDGESLSRIQRAAEKSGQAIPVGIALRVVADACAGLHAAHELRDHDGALLGVVHRDVSPQNLLVGANGAVKVIDFGIAKAHNRFAGETNSGILKGKVHYMPPEQALGRPVDRRADVWALGAVLYQLLAGKAPYAADNQLTTLHLLTSGRPPLPLPDRVPPSVRDVVRRALASEAAARFATAADLGRAIAAAMTGARLATSEADVAAFATTHTGARMEARRKTIKVALEAAAARAQAEGTFEPPAAGAASGVMERRAQSVRARAETVPDVGRLASLPVSEASSATLGSAALAAEVGTPPVRQRSRALLAVAAVIVIGATAMVAWRAGASSAARAPMTATSPAAPPASASAAPSESAPPPSTKSPPPSTIGTAAPTATATAAAPVFVPRPRAAPPPPAPRTAPSRPRPAKVVDDGF